MTQSARLITVLMALSVIAAYGAATAGAQGLLENANVVQDCWTANPEIFPEREGELYLFYETHSIDMSWMHKLFNSCLSYSVLIQVATCRDGKPRLDPADVVYTTESISFGPISPDPEVPERIFVHSLPPGTLPAGRYDWQLVIECNDTNGDVTADGDIDDMCGGNPAVSPLVLGGPVIFGPDPIQVLDPHPGTMPLGRGPGENGTTRPWCFSVIAPPPPFAGTGSEDGGQLAKTDLAGVLQIISQDGRVLRRIPELEPEAAPGSTDPN